MENIKLDLERLRLMSMSSEEIKFLNDFIDSFIDCNYENCAYLFRDYLKSCESYTSIVVHYDFERELFYHEA